MLGLILILIPISIHAPREGRDDDSKVILALHLISIHAPREGRDGRAKWYTIPKSVFQSTRPARGATVNDSFFNDSF